MTMRSLSVRNVEINGAPHAVAFYRANGADLLAMPAWMNSTVPSVAEVAALIAGRALALDKREAKHADQLTRAHTAFDSFAEMLDASGHYRPSLQCTERGGFDPDRRARVTLAHYYDRAQAARGDSRRAYRY